MYISENGKNLIKKYEGCYLETYLCPSGVQTIGWGHTGESAYMGNVITQQKAEQLFDTDILIYENYVNKYVNMGYKFNQNQFDALTSFTYNCGCGALEDVIYSPDICETMSLYVKGNGGVTLQGLVNRRQEEISLYLQPVENLESNINHIVQSGETLSSIAEKYNTTYLAIANYNNLINPDYIYIGQHLTIPKTDNKDIYHIVKSGDTIWGLSMQYNTTIQSIMTLNNIKNPDIIKVGQKLRIK